MFSARKTSDKTGHLMAVIHYVKVDKDKGDELKVTSVDDKTNSFNVIGQELVDAMLSADLFTETKKVPLTEMAEILSRSYNVPFTVKFVKKEGETRTLRGRLVKPEPILGRCSVEDLDVAEGSRLRLVDNRTLLELVVNGVQYLLK